MYCLLAPCLPSSCSSCRLAPARLIARHCCPFKPPSRRGVAVELHSLRSQNIDARGHLGGLTRQASLAHL